MISPAARPQAAAEEAAASAACSELAVATRSRGGRFSAGKGLGSFTPGHLDGFDGRSWSSIPAFFFSFGMGKKDSLCPGLESAWEQGLS